MDMRKAALVLLWSSVTAMACAGTSAHGKRPASFPIPEIKKDCSSCHVVEGTRATAALKKAPPALCLDCHPDRTSPREHRIDIVPTGEVKGLPLFDGRMSCMTCHDPHKNPFGGLLRKRQTDLCLTCHPV